VYYHVSFWSSMISTISFCTKLAYGNSNVVQIVQQTVQEKANNGGNKNITQSLSDMPFQQASPGSKKSKL
jgi:hypothetical protein